MKIIVLFRCTKQMKIIFTTSLYLLLIMIVVPVSAQKKKSSVGYLITQTHDTIACEFVQHSWKKQPASIKVRVNGKDTIIYPGSINSFINPSGNEFVSRKIELFKYNRDIQFAISNDIPSSEIISAAFLKILYRGRITLFLYKDVLGGDHYFIEKNSVLKEIYIHLYYTVGGYVTGTNTKQPVVVNNFQYYYGLKEMMQDCKNIFPEIDKTQLNAKSLISLLQKYDKCQLIPDN